MAQFQTYTKTKLDDLLKAKAAASAVTTNTTNIATNTNDIATLKANAVTVTEDSTSGVITITYGTASK